MVPSTLNETPNAATANVGAGDAFTVHWAASPAEIKEVQRLRYQVFSDELGVNLKGQDGRDVDQFDEHVSHVYVRNNATGAVVGTYRIMTPAAAQITGWYTQQEFDISSVLATGERFMEVGRACVDKNFRNGAVVLMLWKAILRYAFDNQYEVIFGCTSVPISAHSPSIADVTAMLEKAGAFETRYHITPRNPLQADTQVVVNPGVKVALPALVKGYLHLGGKVAGEPSFDPDFHCADFFTFLRMSELSPRYARHMLRG